jgi:signal peptidase I
MATKKVRTITGFGGAMLLILGFVIYFWATFKTVVVSGDSMRPTFKTGTRLLVSDAYWLIGPIKDKDIVVIRGNGPNDYIIKRVYRMGGEVVDWYNVPKTWSLENGEYRVPQGDVYVLGDNRAISEDSRIFGPVDLSKVIGKVVIRPTKKAL